MRMLQTSEEAHLPTRGDGVGSRLVASGKGKEPESDG